MLDLVTPDTPKGCRTAGHLCMMLAAGLALAAAYWAARAQALNLATGHAEPFVFYVFIGQAVVACTWMLVRETRHPV